MNTPSTAPVLPIFLIAEEGVGDYRANPDFIQRFRANWPSIEALGFDARFRRMREYYLAYCEGGFRGGFIDVRQISLVRQPEGGASAGTGRRPQHRSPEP